MNKKLKTLTTRVDVVYFGPLAQRTPVSCKAIINLLNSVKQDTLIVFDINLRQLFYKRNNYRFLEAVFDFKN